MAFELEKYRGAVRAQDSFSIALTVLGLAIAIFLDDAIVRLIGASVALLGGVALYMIVRQRLDDQVQIQNRRTTLPPPNFKTRVTTDPGTSTRRIHFDDFQETFSPVDEDSHEEAADLPASSTLRRDNSRPATPSQPVRHFGDDDEVVEEEGEVFGFTGGDEGAFRVVRPASEGVAGGASQSERSVKLSGAGSARDVASATERSPELAQSVTPGSVSVDTERQPAEHAAPAQPAASQSASAPGVTPVAGSSSGTVPPPAETVPERDSKTRKQVQTILADLASDEGEEERSGEPRAEFVRLVGQVLNAVARSMSARSIVFCWVNLQKGHLIPEARLTTGTYEIRTGVRLPLGSDVISQIAQSGIPEILTDIGRSAERELIPYYGEPADTRSFVGVPVFFRREVVGVLAADSAELNAFDESSVATLAEYTRLIGGLIRGYTEKYDLQLTARTLESFERMQDAFAGAALPPERIGGIVVEQAATLFDHSYIGVVLFDESARQWRIAASSDPGGAGIARLVPDMERSVVGHVTRNAAEIALEQTDREIIFHEDERIEPGGALLSVPLVGTTRCYGAIVVAHSSAAAYISRDLDLLRDLARYAAMAIEVYNVNNAIDSQAIIDEVTGTYNAEFLTALLGRESRRAHDFNKAMCYALVSIDLPASIRDSLTREMDDLIASAVGGIITASVRPYDAIGRVDARAFGVVLVERNDQDAYLWAEKLRKEVASRILATGGRKFSVTVSIGICDVSDLQGSDAVIAGAQQALDRARSGDGNAVILY